MFGIIKENIISNLESSYKEGNKKEFKEKYNNFSRIIKNSKDLKNIYKIYESINKVQFGDRIMAEEFITECLNRLKSYNKNVVNELNSLTQEGFEPDTKSIYYHIDQIIFNENYSIEESIKSKHYIINSLIKKIDSEKLTENLGKSIKIIDENQSKMTPEQIDLLEFFIENDQITVTEKYLNLIDETTNLVENKILETEDGELVKKLVEVKRKLNNLKKEEVTITLTEELIELKKTFE